jgi:hypothetical protein
MVEVESEEKKQAPAVADEAALGGFDGDLHCRIWANGIFSPRFASSSGQIRVQKKQIVQLDGNVGSFLEMAPRSTKPPAHRSSSDQNARGCNRKQISFGEMSQLSDAFHITG